ncbi:MAG: ROK family protein [Salinivirgaceae bacterium]|jgi:glucokinase|nr:ROK family protein [Salinivirgaceae bacterium]
MLNTIVMGIDIGGTSIAAGCLINNKLVNKSTVDTGANNSVSEIISRLCKVINKVYNKDVQAIGIGVPGYIDTDGEIKLINNIPILQGVNLIKKLNDIYKVPVFVNNDANCFALGCYYFNSDAMANDIVGLTLGTGLGGGVVVNGKLHSGLYGGAGEFGCIPYLDATYEDYCSSKFFASKHQTTGKELFIGAQNGEGEALAIFEEFGNHLGNLILNIMYSLAPQKVVIGGSIAKSFDFFRNGIQMVIGDFPVELVRKEFKVEEARFDDPGIHGAAALCLSEVNEGN